MEKDRYKGVKSLGRKWAKEEANIKRILVIEDCEIVFTIVVKDYIPDESKGEYPLEMLEELEERLRKEKEQESKE